jgi:hypothetical protein
MLERANLGMNWLWIAFEEMQFEAGQRDRMHWLFNRFGLQSEGIDRLALNQTVICPWHERCFTSISVPTPPALWDSEIRSGALNTWGETAQLSKQICSSNQTQRTSILQRQTCLLSQNWRKNFCTRFRRPERIHSEDKIAQKNSDMHGWYEHAALASLRRLPPKCLDNLR